MVGERLIKGCLLAGVLLLTTTGCRQKEQQQHPLVIVEKPAKEDVQIFGEYVGRIRAARFVEIHARVEGYLEKMLFAEGKEVKQNEPLFICIKRLEVDTFKGFVLTLQSDLLFPVKTGIL